MPGEQARDVIRARIADGTFPDRLPAEVDLAHELGVARGTLRHALSVLVDDGVLVSIRGRGYFVASTDPLGSIAGRVADELSAVEIEDRDTPAFICLRFHRRDQCAGTPVAEVSGSVDRGADAGWHAVAGEPSDRQYPRIVQICGVQNFQLPHMFSNPRMLAIGFQGREHWNPQPRIRLEMGPMDECGHLPVACERDQGGRIEDQMVQDHAADPCWWVNAARRRSPMSALSSSLTSTPKCSAR